MKQRHVNGNSGQPGPQKTGKQGSSAARQGSRRQEKEGGLLDSICLTATGLTAREYLRLRKLRKELSGTGAKGSAPRTAQQTITFEKMYRDGLCRVSGGYYTMMVEFFDLNYDLLDMEEQAEVLGDYSSFLNCFDPAVRFQIFLFSRKADGRALEAQFEIPPTGDGHDGIRAEFSGMLAGQRAKGSNGIVKGKYLVFGVEAPDAGAARARLLGIRADAVRNLKNIGTEARPVDGEGRLRVLHEFFHQDEPGEFRFSYRDLSGSGKSGKDYVAPAGFDFRYPSRFKSGKMYGSVYSMDILAPRLNDTLLKRILDLDRNISISIHMQTMDPSKAAKMLKDALSNIQKMKIDEQKKAVRSGYDMDILPADIIAYEKDTMDLLADLNSSNQKIIRMTFLIACFGRDKKEMESTVQRVSGIVQQAGCGLSCLMYRQEQGMNAAAPIGCNGTGIERALPTKSAAVLVPFHTQELFMREGEPLYYGLNALSGNMVMADRKKLRTPNGVILGTPGSGKSFSGKREILGCFLMTGDDILICDPEGEYRPLVQALGGQMVKLATTSTDYLNPMDIQLSHRGDREALKLKSDFLITLCDTIAGGEHGLANDEKGIIDRCIASIYAEYFRDPSPGNMPILEDLYNALLRYEPSDGLREDLALDAKAKAVRIANSLVLYVHGSQNYFNHRTSVDSQNRIVCFDIRDLGNQLKELGMLVVQDAVWNRVSRNRERRVATRYYCDEFHLLLRDRQTAQYAVEMWKRFRKWGGIPTALTQNVGDFLRSEEIEGILGNSDFVYLLNQNAKDQSILADKLGLSDRQLAYVTNAEPGTGLILFDSITVPFQDRYPTDTEAYRIMTTKLEEAGKDGTEENVDLQ